MKELNGNLITLALEGKFDVIVHGCNCFCTMGAGIAPQMAKAFGCDVFPLENTDYRGDIDKLGRIDYQSGAISNGKFEWAKSNNFFEGNLVVVNAYTQYDWKPNKNKTPNIDYTALTMCFMKINHIFKGKHIGIPKIGAGLAGGNWPLIRYVIEKVTSDVEITVINYKP